MRKRQDWHIVWRGKSQSKRKLLFQIKIIWKYLLEENINGLKIEIVTRMPKRQWKYFKINVMHFAIKCRFIGTNKCLSLYLRHFFYKNFFCFFWLKIAQTDRSINILAMKIVKLCYKTMERNNKNTLRRRTREHERRRLNDKKPDERKCKKKHFHSDLD